jgi:uncharacterized alkaline shock family protein YloU
MLSATCPPKADPALGEITYSTGVFAKIAQHAVRAVHGVRGIYEDKRLLQRWGKAGRGVRCRESRRGLIVDVAVVARRGATIHDLCRAVQEAIAAAVLKMTDRSDVVVNVSVKAVV